MADGRDGLRTGGMVAGAWTALIVGAGLLLRRSRRMDLAGRTVVITGGSRGLGLLLARRFADKGARLVILARNQGELGRARIELEARGAEVLALPCDVGDEGRWARPSPGRSIALAASTSW